MFKKKEKQKNLFSYLAKYKFSIFVYVLFYLLGGACTVFLTIFFADAITQITADDFTKAIYIFAITIGITVAMRLMFYIAQLIYINFSNKVMSDLNQDLAMQAYKLNSNTFNNHNTGTFVRRIVNDPEQVIMNLRDIVEILIEVLVACAMFVYIAVLNIYVTLVFIGIIILGIFLESMRIKYRRKNRREIKKYGDKIHSLTTEIVKSEKDVKSLGLEKQLSEVSNENYINYREKSSKYSRVDGAFWIARTSMVEIGNILAMILGVVLMEKALLALATFMIIYSSRRSVTDIIWGISMIANFLVEIKISTERMFALFDGKEFVEESFGDKVVENVKGRIEFKNVKYIYKEYEFPEKYDENNKKKKPEDTEIKIKSESTIFENLSFVIEPNTTVAFVGKSGSGKTTILNLMSKMYHADGGEILIDDVNILDFSKESLRNALSLVNQFPYIFDMSIKENLLLAKKDATDEEINDAIKRASLEQFVNGLPEGGNTKVGESGIKLSGGQRQRLAIARAMLRNSPITIFDESTSSLDNYAQGNIKKSIDDMKGKSTIVIVAHRLSTIKNVDKIFFLDKGEIIDEGTFDELFENNESFKTMFMAENL